MSHDAMPLGAHLREDGSCTFCVWAPAVASLQLRIDAPTARSLPMQPSGGYHTAVVDAVEPGTRYSFVQPDGSATPDPASRHQPDGVHGPSSVVPASFAWRTDAWAAPAMRDLVLYELHVGTFTPQGTFDAVIPRLPALRELGVNAIELMPIAQFPGSRNWGYDGVFAFAAHASYGGPEALKRLVDAAHGLDLCVVLDVVYNHLGPEGNYLPLYAPYFTKTCHTPWGEAVNFDAAGCDHVRRYFIESALQWIDEFRIDGLRLDAIHSIFDQSAQPFLRQLAEAVHERAARHGRAAVVIAESDLGDPRVLRPERLGGLDMDAQWLDDFHHALHALLTGETDGYYADFGTIEHLARAFRHGYVYSGQYSAFRQRSHGAPGPDILPHQFVVYAQNHDQIGNRMMGERLTHQVQPAQARLAAAAVLLAPFTPMLFMGEEYGERNPFPYFVSHADEELIAAVRDGRREEFSSFSWQGEPPDPQAEDTFRRAVLDWPARERTGHAELLALHERLLLLRQTAPSIRAADAIAADVLDIRGGQADDDAREGVLIVTRRTAEQSSLLLLNFAGTAARLTLEPGGTWRVALDTADRAWGGDGGRGPATFEIGTAITLDLAPCSAVLLLHDEDNAA
ncbi:MAG: malto-oligosyltrehalose trehalohydrolase [Gemmatimonadota bacterium]